MNDNGNFDTVSKMNRAFGNPKGDPTAIDVDKLKSQCKNILDEYNELMEAIEAQDFYKIRDALCDIHVFTYGAHHIMGLDADADMLQVINAVFTRFVKDPTDRLATLIKHDKNGVYDVYFEGDYPFMIMKSSHDQPDAPKGKFLKSASYREPVFEGLCFAAKPNVVAGNWGIHPDKVGEDTSSFASQGDAFNPYDYDDWRMVFNHIYFSEQAGGYVFSDEASQYDTNLYETFANCEDALANYIKQLG